jgi:hypothetical protein
MAKIINFPNSTPAAPVKKILDVTRRYVYRKPMPYSVFLWCSRALVRTADFLVVLLRTFTLTLLLWFRPILFVVIRPLSGLLLIAFIVCLFTHPADQRLTWGFGSLSFGAFLIMYLYDRLLVFLSCGNVVSILN